MYYMWYYISGTCCVCIESYSIQDVKVFEVNHDDVLSKSRVFVSREETGMTTIDWMNDGCAIFTLTTLTPIPN